MNWRFDDCQTARVEPDLVSAKPSVIHNLVRFMHLLSRNTSLMIDACSELKLRAKSILLPNKEDGTHMGIMLQELRVALRLIANL